MRPSIFRSFAFAAALVALSTYSRAVHAHTVGVSRGAYVLTGSELVATLHFARTELSLAVPDLENDAPEDARRVAVERFFARSLHIAAGGERCTGPRADLAGIEGDGIEVTARFACPPGALGIRIDAAFIAELASGHHHLARTSAFGADASADLSRARSAIELASSATGAAAPTPSPAKTFFRMGIVHILTGYDHLLFLVGLLLVLHPVRSLFWAVTSFTVAHSLTLSLATLGVVGPAPRFVEPAIALSIAYVGIENWFVANAKGRWRITFLFGLLHGFGFAGALREIALPRAELPLALFSFNLGVELGQLAVVAPVLAALLWAHNKGLLESRRLRMSSVPVAAMGLIWFAARVAA